MTPWTGAHQAPLSMGFSRREYWSGLPFPSPGDLPDPGIKPRTPAIQADSLPTELPGDSQIYMYHIFFIHSLFWWLLRLVAQTVKCLPTMWETWVQSLGQEDLLEKGIYSSILAWGIPWKEGPGGLQSMGSQRAGHDWLTNTFTFNIIITNDIIIPW